MSTAAHVVRIRAETDDDVLDRVFFALSDPARRAILQMLDVGPRLVSELAAPFDISLQAVSRHIQVLVRAGLVQQQRTGRIARCSLDAGPILTTAVWINRYSKYWQQQFDTLALALETIEERRADERRGAGKHAHKRRSLQRRRHARGSKQEVLP
jgi:DNA-binding transcriptional ArsR family regulator